MSGRDHNLGSVGLRAFLRLIGLFSLIVPEHSRQEWRREWEAEIWHRWLTLVKWQRINFRTKFQLLKDCLGAIFDAAFLRFDFLKEQTLLQELSFGLQTLCKIRGLTIVALLALSLSIGASGLIFSIVEAALIRPLPYEEPDQLVMVWNNYSGEGLEKVGLSLPEYIDFRDRNMVFEQIEIFTTWNVNLTSGEKTKVVQAANVSEGFFHLLGSKAAMGSTSLETYQEHYGPVAIVSNRLWRDHFLSDPDIIGKNILINTSSCTVIGVMPEEFDLPSRTEIWFLLNTDDGMMSLYTRTRHLFRAIARLKPNLSSSQAQVEMNEIADQIDKQYQEVYNSDRGWYITVVPLRQQIFGEVRSPLILLIAAAGLIFILACSSITNLLIESAALRQREMPLRSNRLKRPLSECLLLAIAGCATGILLLIIGLDAIAKIYGELPRIGEIRVDGRVLGFTTILSFSISFLLAPISFFQPKNRESGKSGCDRATHGLFHSQTIRSILLISQVAISLILIIAAGLMFRSSLRMKEVELGFNEKNVLTAGISISEKYRTTEQINSFLKYTTQRIASLDGIESVGVISHLPFSGRNASSVITFEDRYLNGDNYSPSHEWRIINPGYFQVMKIPLLQGRYFTEQDDSDNQGVVIVNKALVDKEWPGEDPIGKQIRLAIYDEKSWRTVVGVVGNVRDFGLDEEYRPELYLPASQKQYRSFTLVVRTDKPEDLTALIKSELIAIDKSQPGYNIKTMEQFIEQSITTRRFSMLLLVLFAAISLLLSIVSIYFLMVKMIDHRKSGVKHADLIKVMMKEGMLLIIIGIEAGLIATYFFASLMDNLLFGISTRDPYTITASTLLFICVTFTTIFIPILRAAKSDNF